jgi:hypothetical protein
MGSSTTTLQSITDYVAALGELGPVLPTGGFSVNTALGIGTDVMLDLISQRFNWKWNRMKIPPFYTSSWQQDYAGIGSTYSAYIGWLEGGYWIDINNTALPKPTWPIEAVRDLPVTSISGNPPGKIAWLPNNQLNQGVWPGPGKAYTAPLGAVTTPTNPPINILDANGNILVLTTYGVTGLVAPVLPASSAEGVTVNDGTCVWTVAGPNSQGFRILPLPPQQAVVYQINVVAQMRAPAPFTSMGAFINPVPDDYANWFRDGFIAGCYKMSPNPQMRALYYGPRGLHESWLGAMEAAMKQGDRETDNAGFIPDRSVVAPQGGYDIGPANPFMPGYMWPGR